MQRGRVLVDSRFPWHVPLYKWVIFQCTQFVLVGLIVSELGGGHVRGPGDLARAGGPGL